MGKGLEYALCGLDDVSVATLCFLHLSCYSLVPLGRIPSYLIARRASCSKKHRGGKVGTVSFLAV